MPDDVKPDVPYDEFIPLPDDDDPALEPTPDPYVVAVVVVVMPVVPEVVPVVPVVPVVVVVVAPVAPVLDPVNPVLELDPYVVAPVV